MRLESAKFLKQSGQSSGNVLRPFSGETGWPEVTRGLLMVVVGYCVLFGGALVGSLLIGAVVGPNPLARWLLPPAAADKLLPLGVVTLLAAAALSYTLVLLGQWRCLLHAPQRQGAKEIMLVGFYCVLVCSLLSLVGTVASGQDIYEAIRRGELDRLNWWGFGVLLLLGSALLGLAASLVFSQFLRTIACCFNDQKRARQVDLNLAFVGLLVGGSAGAVVCFWQVASQATLLPWLAAGWVLCLAWHLLLIVGIRRCIFQALRRLSGLRKPLPSAQLAGGPRTHSLSGLRRLAQPPS